MAPQMLKSRDLTSAQLAVSAVADGTVRLSIGLEDPDDLSADIERALTIAEA